MNSNYTVIVYVDMMFNSELNTFNFQLMILELFSNQLILLINSLISPDAKRIGHGLMTQSNEKLINGLLLYVLKSHVEVLNIKFPVLDREYSLLF